MRKLTWIALAYAGAVFLAQYLLPGGAYLPAAALCALLSLPCLLLPADWRRRCVPVALAMAAGFCWCFGYNALFYAPAEPLIGQTAAFSGRVEDYPTETEYGYRVSIQVDTATVPVRALFYLSPDSPELRPGDRVSGAAAFQSAKISRDEEVTYYTAKGIYLVADSVSGLTVQRPDRLPFAALPAELAHRIGDSLDRLFSPNQAAFLKALLTGNRAALTDASTTSLSRSGLSHTVAVSGMHVSCLAGAVYLLLPNRRRRLACIPVLLLFAGIAGFTPSVTRAVTMQIIFILSALFRRENDPPTSLSLALLLLLVWNPYSISSISLQLSFASVSGILLLAGPLYEKAVRRFGRRDADGQYQVNPALKLLLAAVTTTLGAMVFTTPLVAYYFETVSLIAPLSNLLTLWVVSLAFCGGMLAALCGLFLPLPAQVLAALTAPLVSYITAAVQWLGSLPLAALTTDSPYVRLWLLHLYVLLAAVLLFPSLRRRPWLPIGCSAAVLILSLCLTRLTFTAADLTVSVLDVGQGQSVLLLSQGRAAAVDCGGNSLSSPGDVLADHLQDIGLSRLDYLIFTHLHSDHANGVRELFARIRVDAVILPVVEEESPWQATVLQLAEEQGSQVVWLSENAQYGLGEARLTLYAPLGAGDQNEEGLSVLCSAGDFDVLLTGDMTSAIEKRLVRYGDLPDIEVLVAGHHGSKYASSQELLSAARPEVAVISVGYNHYGHPADETLLRLQTFCQDVYRTDLNGDVTIRAQDAS